jgi:hypothetical protein
VLQLFSYERVTPILRLVAHAADPTVQRGVRVVSEYVQGQPASSSLHFNVPFGFSALLSHLGRFFLA